MTDRKAETPDSQATAEAAGWVVRLTADKADTTRHEAFRAWHAASEENRQAFRWARAAYTDADLLPLRRSPPKAGVMARAGWTMAGAVAAGLAAMVLLPSLEVMGADHLTRPGEVRQLTLEDGTRLWLDTNSAVDVRYGADGRTLDLRRGRLFVEVANGDARPFGVQTEGAVIRDIGTSFAVDRIGEGFSVEVSDGIVDIKNSAGVTRLRAGQARTFNAGPSALRAANPDRQAWRDGRLLLDRIPMREAIAAIGRYRSDRLVWMAGDNQTAVSGVLDLKRLDEGLETLAADHDLRLVRLPGVTFLVQNS